MNWLSRENELLLNPRLPGDALAAFEKSWLQVAHMENQVGLATSGSSGGHGKLIVLSRDAILASARAVNERLGSTKEDIWFKALPDFHVGGLGILARAHLSGAVVREYSRDRWEPQTFIRELDGATIVSLVPTQLFDLVQAGLSAPGSLRAAIIGGARLGEPLRLRARELGWPALPSYGLTECCSQVATALSPDEPALTLLSHVEARVTEGRIEIRSPALLSGFIEEEFTDPKRDGWFLTDDIGEVRGRELEVHGRSEDFVKVAGEGVWIPRLEERLRSLGYKSDAAVLAARDERLGAKIVLLATLAAENLKEEFNRSVAPFERAREAYTVETIPRSPLGKLLRGQALALVGLKLPPDA